MSIRGWIFILTILGLLMNIQAVSANEFKLLGKYEAGSGSVVISGDGSTILYDEFNGSNPDRYIYTITAIDKKGEQKWVYEVATKISIIYENNRGTALPTTISKDIDTSFDGDYTVFGFNSELYLLDGNGKLRWKYKPDNLKNNYNYLNFNRVSLSSDGKYIATLLYDEYRGMTFDGGTIFLLDNKGLVLWSYSIQNNENMVEVSISPDGKYVSVITLLKVGEKIKSKIYLFDATGNILKILDTEDLYSTTYQKNIHDGIVLGRNSKIIFLDYNLNEKWKTKKFIFESKAELLASSLYGDMIVIQAEAEEGSEGKLKFIKNREISEEYNIDDAIHSISISAEGAYVAARSNDYIYILGKESPLNLLYPKPDGVLDTQQPRFDWDDIQGATKYFIKIDGETFEITSSEYTPAKNLSLGGHEWRVKAVQQNIDSFWSQSRNFSIVSSEEKTIKKTIEKRVVDIRVLAGGVIVSILLLGIVVRPIYKRWIVKKTLKKTATDWCPQCHKFSGGAKICPHCGKDTLVSDQ